MGRWELPRGSRLERCIGIEEMQACTEMHRCCIFSRWVVCSTIIIVTVHCTVCNMCKGWARDARGAGMHVRWWLMRTWWGPITDLVRKPITSSEQSQIIRRNPLMCTVHCQNFVSLQWEFASSNICAVSIVRKYWWGCVLVPGAPLVARSSGVCLESAKVHIFVSALVGDCWNRL